MTIIASASVSLVTVAATLSEVVAIWKTWNALNSKHTAGFDPPTDAKWDCLLRATAAEGEIESLIAKVASDRLLTNEDIEMLGSLRQAFKTVRRRIREDKPIGWTSAQASGYVAFKSLAAAMSVLLSTKTSTRRRPSAAQAAEAFKAITDNRHEATWKRTILHSAPAAALNDI